MRSCALAAVGLGPLAAAVKLADLNWHSADLVNAAFIESACSEYEEDCPVSVGPKEFTSSADALQSLAEGQVDFFLECWGNCSLEGLRAEPLGFVGTYGLYVPTWLLELEPSLGSIEAWRAAAPLQRGERQLSVVRGHEVEVLGFPETWSVGVGNLREFYARVGLEVLNASLQTFPSPEAFDSRLLSNLKGRRPMIFMYWEPSTLIGEPLYQVTRLQVPAEWQSSFPAEQISKVRRSAHAPRDFLVYFDGFGLSGTAISDMLRGLVRRVSPAVPGHVGSYALAVQEVAALRECGRTGRHCSVLGQKWPKPKDPSLPEKLLVLVKRCSGFVEVLDPALLTEAGGCNSTSQANLRPSGLEAFQEIDGYTVQHILRTVAMLGYSQHDVIFRCTETTTDLVQRTAMDLTHMGGACVTMSASRVPLVDFSAPTYSTAFGFMVLSSGGQLKFWGFFSPFAPETWVGIVLLLLLTAVVMYALEHPSHIVNACRAREKRELDANGHALSVLDPVLDVADLVKRGRPSRRSQQDLEMDDVVMVRTTRSVIRGRVSELDRDSFQVGEERFSRQEGNFKVLSRGVLALSEFGKIAGRVGTMAAGKDAVTRSFKQAAGRAAASLTVLSGTLLVALYTASLASYLSQKPAGAIDSVQKLAGRRVGVWSEACLEQCGAWRCEAGPKGGLRRNAIEHYVDEVMNSGNQQRICLHPDDLTEAFNENVVDAIIGDMAALQVRAKNENDRLDTCTFVVQAALAQDYGYTFPRGSLLAAPISQAALHISLTTNTREELDAKFFGLSKACSGAKASTRSLTPWDVGGLFLLHAIGLVALAAYGVYQRLTGCCTSVGLPVSDTATFAGRQSAGNPAAGAAGALHEPKAAGALPEPEEEGSEARIEGL